MRAMFTTRRSFIRALRLRPVIDACAKQDLLIGRRFPPLTRMARISIGTLDEMKRGLDVLDTVLRAGTGH